MVFVDEIGDLLAHTIVTIDVGRSKGDLFFKLSRLVEIP